MLRSERAWSLEDLAARTGVSRATLSRLEKSETSPTTDVLARICAAYEMSMSHLLLLVEDGFTAHVPLEDQPEWQDPATGFTRRSVSTPASQLRGEVLECHLPPGTQITYDAPPMPGQEHHLVMLDGALDLGLGSVTHHLSAGDCLRYQLSGASAFRTAPDRGARYILVLI